MVKALQHTFTDAALLQLALRHRSADAAQHYERLEFLGDRVLNLAVAEALYKRYPQAQEGELAKRHAALVREETLAQIARAWELGQHIEMSDAEAASGGQDKNSILADAVESVLAALYLDAGMAPVQQLIEQYWTPLFESVPLQDPKTALQEWLQAKGAPLPVYTQVDAQGALHEREFTMQVAAEGFGTAQGMGRSKQAASQQAAAMLLEQIKESENT